jgi:HD-like signal output (HDOD) protein
MKSNSAPPEKGAIASLSQEAFLERLRQALSEDGDFPTSAKIVTELKVLTANPNTSANQVAEVILREPSLGARVLHIVNSSFYHRGKPIMTISQAVMRLGMKPLAELCSGLVLLQKFGTITRRGDAFSRCLTQTIITGLVSGALVKSATPASPQGQGPEESGYLAGSLSEMGTLLLAYYFPELYENANKRAEQKNVPLAQSITEIVGLAPIQISLEVVRALNLPDLYRSTLEAIAKPGALASSSKALPSGPVSEAERIARAATAISAARDISESISSHRGKGHLDQILSQSATMLKCSPTALGEVLGKLSPSFSEHCAAIELKVPALPDFLNDYSRDEAQTTPITKATEGGEDRFQQFVDEIRQAVDAHEPSSSVITTVMETLAFGLEFNRVVLLLATSGKRSVQGRMMLGGSPGFDPKKIDRPLGAAAGQFAPDAKAFQESRVVFAGDPVLEDGWPFVVIPLGFGKKAIGVIYADRTIPDAQELSTREKAAIGMLAELIDKSLSLGS